MPRSIESVVFRKRVGETLDYDFDYTDFLTEVTDTITSSTVVASPSGLTLGTKNETNYIVKQFISAGTDGQDYEVTCTMTSAGGRVDILSFTLQVREA